jgi:hypothetical protein
MSFEPRSMRSERIPCPVHRGGDPNCTVWFDERGRLHHAKCWSHSCSSRAILVALGATPNRNEARRIVTRSLERSEALAAARSIWNVSRPALGTLAHRYLKRARGINIEPPASLRYHPNLKHPSGAIYPAMVACVESRDGRFIGVHRTWLDALAASLKAPAEPQKAALGSISGGAIRLAGKLSETVTLCEGIEDGLSILQATGFTVWVATSTSGLRSVELPDCVHTVIIAGDNDTPGREAVRAAAMRFHSEGRKVCIAYPTAGKDFNDLLRAHA